MKLAARYRIPCAYVSDLLLRSKPLLMAALALLPACSGSSTLSYSPPPAVRQQLETIVSSAVGADVPGAVVQIITPGWRWTWAAGNAQITPPIPAQPDMHFRIASVSKTFTATAILKLAEDKRLNLDDPIEKWLPATYLQHMTAFPYHDITLRMLLNHRSSIPDYDEMGVLIPLQMSQPEVPVTTDFAIFSGLDLGPLPYPPGGGYTYSNINFLLLARVIDAASDMSYENYVRSVIIDHLGLKHTFMTTDPPTSTMPLPFMHCLYPVDQKWVDYSTMYLQWDRGAGDITSTVDDLNTFHRALREDRIINADSLREMRTFLPATSHEGAAFYGLGYSQASMPNVGATVQGHSGGYAGSFTNVFYLVEKDTYIALNVNGTTSGPVVRALVAYLMHAL